MISAALVRLPDTLQVAGKRAAGTHDIVLWSHHRAQGCQRRSLGKRGAVQSDKFRNGALVPCLDDRLKLRPFADNAAKALQFLVPFLLCFFNLCGISGAVPGLAQNGAERLHALAGVADRLDRVKFVRVETADIDRRETHIFIVEQPLGAGRKVGHAGTDSDHAVRFFRNLVGRGGTGYADAAKAVRVTGL